MTRSVDGQERIEGGGCWRGKHPAPLSLLGRLSLQLFLLHGMLKLQLRSLLLLPVLLPVLLLRESRGPRQADGAADKACLTRLYTRASIMQTRVESVRGGEAGVTARAGGSWVESWGKGEQWE